MPKRAKINLLKISQALVGSPYCLGSWDRKKGLDCFSLVGSYLKMRGVTLDREMEGVKIDDYKELFLREPEKAKALMVLYIEKHMDELPISKRLAGDVLLLSLANQGTFLAIDGGNGNIVAASEENGVSVTPLNHYSIEKAFRCRKHYHS